MKQKVALAGALIHEPQLLMLDEPLTGLDAAAARQVKDILTARVRAGATIIMTTHILEVAERLADRIGIIARGRMIAEGTLDELRASAERGASRPRALKISSSTSPREDPDARRSASREIEARRFRLVRRARPASTLALARSACSASLSPGKVSLLIGAAVLAVHAIAYPDRVVA